MTSNGKDSLWRLGEAADRVHGERETGRQESEPAEDDGTVRALLDFLRWSTDVDAPVTDAQVDYVLRMTAAMEIPAERIARVREHVLRTNATASSVSPEARAGTPARASSTDASSQEGGWVGATEGTELQSVAPLTRVGASAGFTPQTQASTARPSFWRRCRELKRQIKDVVTNLRLNDEVLLALEQGQSRSVPQALLTKAAAFVDYDEPTLARCFAPDAGDVLPLAAHDQSRHTSVAASLDDFLTIVEESELSDSDKKYWRAIVQAETAREGPREIQ